VLVLLVLPEVLVLLVLQEAKVPKVPQVLAQRVLQEPQVQPDLQEQLVLQDRDQQVLQDLLELLVSKGYRERLVYKDLLAQEQQVFLVLTDLPDQLELLGQMVTLVPQALVLPEQLGQQGLAELTEPTELTEELVLLGLRVPLG
jgi:hypothetical protein